MFYSFFIFYCYFARLWNKSQNISNPYVLRNRHEHLGCFHSLMFCLKLTRELLLFSQVVVAIIVVLCMYTIVSSAQYTVFGNSLSRSLKFLMVYGIFLSLKISSVIGEDTPFRDFKILGPLLVEISVIIQSAHL